MKPTGIDERRAAAPRCRPSYGPRPRLGRAYYKAHGLGNDYLVFEEGDAWVAEPDAVSRVCHRWEGVGGDGIVVLLGGGRTPPFRLRMFNPDGSEFERSGNGLRILASHLYRKARVARQPFEVEVGGDVVRMVVHGTTGADYDIAVEMGTARVGPEAVKMDPGALLGGDRLEGPEGMPLHVVPVSVGNPHVVVLLDHAAPEDLHRVGPFVSAHPALAEGANVQLAWPDGEGGMRALIWERGVGPTSASGTSACAVAVAAVSAGVVSPGQVRVGMEGGELQVRIGPGLAVTLRGPVTEVCEGRLSTAYAASLPSQE